MIQPNGTVLACGEGSYGRLGQGNSDDLHVLTVISALQGDTIVGCTTQTVTKGFAEMTVVGGWGWVQVCVAVRGNINK